VKKVLNFVKRFPLVSYGFVAVVITIFTYFQKDYSDSILLMMLAMPIFVVYGKLCDLVCWRALSSYADIFLMFIPTLVLLVLLDLLLLFIRTKLLPKLKSKLTKNQREI